METQNFQQFIDNLSFVKDINQKTELIKGELKKLNRIISAYENETYGSRLERFNKKFEYSEMLNIKGYLSLELSLLQSELSVKP